MNDAFGVMYEQLQPKLFLFAGPSATKHGPNTCHVLFLLFYSLFFYSFEPIFSDLKFGFKDKFVLNISLSLMNKKIFQSDAYFYIFYFKII
jgi:hypothetical protein